MLGLGETLSRRRIKYEKQCRFTLSYLNRLVFNIPIGAECFSGLGDRETLQYSVAKQPVEEKVLVFRDFRQAKRLCHTQIRKVPNLQVSPVDGIKRLSDALVGMFLASTGL